METVKARTKEEVAALVAEQISLVHDQTVAAKIRSLLVEPYAVDRAWDYGKPGDSYVCWTVLEHPESNTAIAYCADGFGDYGSPWGLVWLSGSLGRHPEFLMEARSRDLHGVSGDEVVVDIEPRHEPDMA